MDNLEHIRKIVFLSGAGISSVETLHTNPEVVQEFYRNVHREVFARKPNAGHLILARLQERFEVTVITQNIDGYHQEAGSSDVIELHGTVRNLRCTDDRCGYRSTFHEDLRNCPTRGKLLRPDIVLFGELIGTSLLKARNSCSPSTRPEQAFIFWNWWKGGERSSARPLPKWTPTSQGSTLLRPAGKRSLTTSLTAIRSW